MDQIGQLLREVSADPPPTHIDMDKLVATQRRATTRRRLVTATTAALATVAVTAYGINVLGPNGASRPVQAGSATPSAAPGSATPAPSPTAAPKRSTSGRWAEPVDDAKTRLSMRTVSAFGAVLAALPAGQRFDINVESGPEVYPGGFFMGGPPDNAEDRNRPTFGYKALLQLSDEAGVSHLVISLSPQLPGPRRPCADQRKGTTCTSRSLPDGSTVERLVEPLSSLMTKELPPDVKVNPDDVKKAVGYSVTIRRPDGSGSFAMLANYDGMDLTRPRPTLTFAQLEALLLAPGMTFYP